MRVDELPEVQRVVLVGNKISPARPDRKPDGTVVRTLWGELAWQLGGKDAYARIAEDDQKGTSPGDALRGLFNDYGPCLILIDEWVAYARQLHDRSDLPAGSFETQFTFAQVLTESAKAASNCLLVISLPGVRHGRVTAHPGPTMWKWAAFAAEKPLTESPTSLADWNPPGIPRLRKRDSRSSDAGSSGP